MRMRLLLWAGCLCLIPLLRAGCAVDTGCITLLIPADTFMVDFSVLEQDYTTMAHGDPRPSSPDIVIDRAEEISSSMYSFWITCPYGIVDIDDTVDCYARAQPALGEVSFDSLLEQSIPAILAGQSRLLSNDTLHRVLFSPDMHCNSFLLRTAEGGCAFIRPIGHYIGGIDRLHFFWLHTTSDSFTVEDPAETGCVGKAAEHYRRALHSATCGVSAVSYSLLGREIPCARDARAGLRVSMEGREIRIIAPGPTVRAGNAAH